MGDELVIKGFETGKLFNNVYVAHCARSGQGMIIDATGGAGRISGYIKEKGITIKHIIYTHCHVDHVFSATKLMRITGARISAHSSAAAAINRPGMKLMSGFGLFFKPEKPAVFLEDGDFISIGMLQFRVLHTPGHSPDSICIEGHGAVFTGDTLFADGVGRTDLPGGSASDLLRSIKEKLLPLPPETAVYPGHGPFSTIAHEMRSNPMLA